MELKLTLPALLAVFIFAACENNQTTKTVQKPQKEVVEKVKKINVLATREGLETRFKEIGLPIYPGAIFEKTRISNSTFDGGHHILYNLPETTTESKEKVAKFYADVFKKFKEEGWKNPHKLWWHKGNDQFTFSQMYMKNPPMHAIGITYKNKTE